MKVKRAIEEYADRKIVKIKVHRQLRHFTVWEVIFVGGVKGFYEQNHFDEIRRSPTTWGS